MKSSQEWINELNLIPHVEGGFYRQVYKSDEKVRNNQRSLYTSIYFLLDTNHPSHLHRLTCDELWYFHGGKTLTIHIIHPSGHYQQVAMGPDIKRGQVLSYIVPKGCIFGSTVKEDYAVVSCLCAPGFEYDDFELFSRQDLLDLYPQHQEIILKLTR